MKNQIFKAGIIILSGIILASCGGNNSSNDESKTGASDSLDMKSSSISMEIETYSDKEKSCETEECTHINLKIPVLGGGNDVAVNQINTFIDGQYREAVKSRLPEPTGNTTLDAMCASFIEGYKLFMLEFPDSEQKWYLEIDGSESIVAPDYFTVVINHAEYLGGAHPATFVQLQSFDLATGNMISISDKYRGNKLKAIAEKMFREKNGLDSTTDLNDAGFMFKDGQFVLPENMGLTPDGVLMVYNSYEVASFDKGETRFIIPYNHLVSNSDV